VTPRTKATVIGLREARERLGLTQLQIATEAGVSPPVIVLLEKGMHVKVSTARKVANVFLPETRHGVKVVIGGAA